MISTCQTISVEADYTEPFEDRVDILYRELELATKWQRPSLLLVIYSSEYVHADADIALENHLANLGQRAYHIKIKNKDDADVISLISELANVKNVTFFVEGLRWGGQEDSFKVYRHLNKHREFFIENQVRVVFWLTESEAVDFAHYAPDCWAFRHRVIEFIDPPRTEQISPRLLESAWQGFGEFPDTLEDLDAKIAFRAALLTDLPGGNESTAARANLLLTLGILHWRRGDYERAAQCLNSTINLAVKLQDNCFEALCYNAIALVETDLGRYGEAIQAYQRAIALAPEKIYPWNNLGSLYGKLGQLDESLSAYQKAIEQNADDAVSWNGLGDVYQKLGHTDDAIYAYLKTIELAPDYAHTWSSLGNSYANDERLEDAFAAHQKALEIDRRIISSWIGLGRISRRQGRAEDAIRAYQTAAELDPKNAQAWNELGDTYRRLGDYENAIAAYRKADELDPATAARHENPPAAESESPNASPEVDPENPIPTPHENLVSESLDPGIACQPDEMSLPAGAVETQADVDFAEWLNKLCTPSSNLEPIGEKSATGADSLKSEKTEENETRPEAPTSVPGNLEPESACWIFKGDNRDSHEDEIPSNPEPASPVVLGGRILSDHPGEDDAATTPQQDPEPAKMEEPSLVLTQDNEPESAGQTQTEIDIKNAQIWSELGNIYFNSGAYDEALHAFTTAIELDPTCGWPYNNLASIYVHRGQYAEAIPLYKKGISLLNKAKDKALLWNRLGDAYRRLDDSDNAMSAYQKAMELDPDKASLLTRARLSLLGNCRA